MAGLAELANRNAFRSLLDHSGETLEQRDARLEKAVRAAMDAYMDFVEHLGIEKANRTWARFVQKRSVGRPKGPKDPSANKQLLMVYDALVNETGKKPNKVKLANELHSENRNRFGNTPDGIKKNLDRLLKAREKTVKNMLAALVSNSEFNPAGSWFDLALSSEPLQAAREAAPKSAQGNATHSARRLDKKSP